MLHPHTTAEEQAHLDSLLELINSRRESLESRLKEVRKQADIDDPQGLMLRDREAADIAARLDSLSAADVGLMFGRIDIDDPSDPEPDNPIAYGETVLDRRYIGRIGVHDTDETMRTLLMDWRAPQARPFYLATALHPEGVHTRRHITTRGHKVISTSDETLIGSPGDGHRAGAGASGDNVGKESALLDAINAARTPHMRDIVETIAAEQDQIIRSTHRGVTVVQGAPGTGKTAVALHRAAYLLYTWREQLAHTGVLIIGPNTRFLDYISHVLPSLGETGVVLATPGTLLPGITTVPEHDLLAREVKGSREMVHILKNTVQSWQTVPRKPIELSLDGVPIVLTPAMVKAARTRARRSRKPHNQAQALFLDHVLDSLADALMQAIGSDPLGGRNLLSAADRAQLRDDLAGDTSVMEQLHVLWPRLTPEQVLRELFTDLDRLEEATSEYDDATREGLRSSPSDGLPDSNSVDGWTWTDADTPLLDELAELLGVVDDDEALANEREQWLDAIADAQDALDILTGSASQDLDDGFDAEILMAYDIVDAEALASRHVHRESLSTAQRAAADIRWAFGHVIVDEAQELSAMAWRMVFRRSPNRWMTIVGDPAQTGNPAGVEEWNDALGEFVDTRWALHQLTVNYRTPKDIAAVANQLLPHIAPDQQAAIALRETGTGVRYFPLADAHAAVAGALGLAGDGLVGVICATADHGEALTRALAGATPEGTASGDATTETATPEGTASGDATLDADNVVVCDISAAKGLEFDEVVVVDPPQFLTSSPQGINDLYVAFSRATQGLSIVGDWPIEL